MKDTSRTVNCRCLHHDLGHTDSNWKKLEKKSEKKVFEAIEGWGGKGGGREGRGKGRAGEGRAGEGSAGEGRAGEGRAGGVARNHGLWIKFFDSMKDRHRENEFGMMLFNFWTFHLMESFDSLAFGCVAHFWWMCIFLYKWKIENMLSVVNSCFRTGLPIVSLGFCLLVTTHAGIGRFCGQCCAARPLLGGKGNFPTFHTLVHQLSSRFQHWEKKITVINYFKKKADLVFQKI